LRKEVAFYNKITLFRDNQVEVIKETRNNENINVGNLNLKKNNNKHLRLITLKEMYKVLDLIETSSITFHYKHGLPTTLKSEAIISLLFPKPIVKESKLIFFQFPLVKDSLKDHKLVKSIYDFPQYCSNYPNGIALFMSIEETELADNYINKTEKITTKGTNIEELRTIKPRKEHNYCQLCLSHFTNYDEVISD
jgi:hypothetical protein